MCYVDLPKNTLFSCFGIIQPVPSMLPGEFSMERMNLQISGLYSKYKDVALATAAITRLTHRWSR
jgi:hypothetical protein